ncbi:MAG: LysR substrate-binding domain-containing protein [Pseudomonadota bacterium]
MPSLRQLEYLLAVAELRHFRRAAAKVGVSQPTLSAQINALEERLGAQLVERSRSRVLLTPVGEQVTETARRIMRDVQEIREIATHKLGEPGGTIRLGLPPTIGPYLMPRVIPKIHRAYPDLKLYVREDIPSNLPDGLDSGKYDVLIAPIPVKAEGMDTIHLFREPLHLVVPADSDLGKRESIERKELKHRSILTLETGHHLRELVVGLCDDFGAELRAEYEGTSLDTLRQMVGMGMGLSFLPGLYVRSELRGGGNVKQIELKGRTLYRTIGMIWRNTSARKPEFEQLGQHIRDAVKRSFTNFPILSG